MQLLVLSLSLLLLASIRPPLAGGLGFRTSVSIGAGISVSITTATAATIATRRPQQHAKGKLHQYRDQKGETKGDDRDGTKVHQVGGHPKDDFFPPPQEPDVNDDRMDQVGPKGETGQRCPDAPTQDASDDARDVDGCHRGVVAVVVVVVVVVLVPITSTIAFVQTQMEQ